MTDAFSKIKLAGQGIGVNSSELFFFGLNILTN
jgi:hypothetical protein